MLHKYTVRSISSLIPLLLLGCGMDSTPLRSRPSQLIAPTVDKLTRPVCSQRGGCVMTITGLDFDPDAAVSIDGLAAPVNPGASSSTELQVAVPVPRSGSLNKWVDVKISNAPGYDRLLAGAFLYYGDDLDYQITYPKPAAVTDTVQDIFVADVNRDYKPDLIVANRSGSLEVFLNMGSRSYSAPIRTPVGGKILALSMFDDRGYSSVDLAASVEGIGLVMLSSRVDGAFIPTPYPAPPLSRLLAKRGWVFGLANGGSTLLLWDGSLGTGAWGATKTFILPAAYSGDMTVADMNGDGADDLILTGKSEMLIAYNTSGVMTTPAPSKPFDFTSPGYQRRIPTTETVLGIAALRLNSDTRLDLLVTKEGSSNSDAYYQAADGSFPRVDAVYSLGAPYRSITRVDLNGDGNEDVLFSGVPTGVTNKMSALMGPGIPSTVTSIDAGILAESFRVADLDADRRPDLIAVRPQAPLRPSNIEPVLISYALPTYGGAPSFLSPEGVATGMTGSTLSALRSVTLAGSSFLLATDQSNDRLHQYQVSRDGTIKPTGAYLPTGNGPNLLVTFDGNKDGYPDALVGNYAGHSVTLFWGTASGGMSRGVDIALSTTYALEPLALATGDFDGNTWPDFAVLARDAVDPANKVFVVPFKDNMAMRTYTAQTPIPVNRKARALLLANLNDEPKDELVVAYPDSGEVGIWQYNAMTLFPTTPTQLIATEGLEPMALHRLPDINGDLRNELLVVHRRSKLGQPHNVRVLLGDKDLKLRDADELSFASCAQPTSTLQGNLNNDSYGDLVISCWGGTDQLWLGVDHGYFGLASVTLRREVSGPLTMFSDGDGRPELASADPLRGLLYALKAK